MVDDSDIERETEEKDSSDSPKGQSDDIESSGGWTKMVMGENG